MVICHMRRVRLFAYQAAAARVLGTKPSLAAPVITLCAEPSASSTT